MGWDIKKIFIDHTIIFSQKIDAIRLLFDPKIVYPYGTTKQLLRNFF